MKKEFKKIVFIGGVGGSSQFGGELTKNKEIINRLRELHYRVSIIDTSNANHCKRKLIAIIVELFYSFLFRRKSVFIFSTAFSNIYPFLKYIAYIPIRYHIVYWAIGGLFGERVERGDFLNKYLNVITLFLVEGKKMVRQLNSAGFKNVLYVPNFKTIGNRYLRYNEDSVKTKFLFISRIMPEKGCDNIESCVANLNKARYGDKYLVDFYGEISPDYYSHFIDFVKNNDNVSYNGKIDLMLEDNYKRLSQYDYMLFPTRWIGEGFPGVIVDAYKLGIPVIASDWNFNEEFIQMGKSGIVVPTNDAEALENVMRQCIYKQIDRQAMSEFMYKNACLYETRNVVTTQLINSIITNK